MLTKMDLAALAEDIQTPYRPQTLVRLGAAEGALVICEGPRRWSREAKHHELWLVLEGVITLDTPTHRVVVSEGELATVPQKAPHTANSGMRSPVLIVSEVPADGSTNGHLPPPFPPDDLSKQDVGRAVHSGAPFHWIEVGTCGKHTAHATRVFGTSLPYQSNVALLLVVYRGVLDYATEDDSGTVVGSQLLYLPSGTTITLSAERGATVVLFHPNGAPLPEPSTAVTGAAEG